MRLSLYLKACNYVKLNNVITYPINLQPLDKLLDQISLKVIPLDRTRVGHQPLYIFIFLNLSLNFIMVFKVLIHLIQKYLPSSYFFGRRFVCAQTAIFFNELVSKKCGNYIFYVCREVQGLQKGCGIRVAQRFDGFFHQSKVCQRIGRKDSLQSANRMRRLDVLLYLAAQNFSVF